MSRLRPCSGKDRRLLVLVALGLGLLFLPRAFPHAREPVGSRYWYVPDSKGGGRGVIFRFPARWTPAKTASRQEHVLQANSSGHSAATALDGAVDCRQNPLPARVALFFSCPVAINQADSNTLTMLPGIGPRLAGSIISFRSVHGPIRSIDEFMQIPGIGQGRATRLAPLLVFK